jgi:hypothetical protein
LTKNEKVLQKFKIFGIFFKWKKKLVKFCSSELNRARISDKLENKDKKFENESSRPLVGARSLEAELLRSETLEILDLVGRNFSIFAH